jgi:hypothetical protein
MYSQFVTPVIMMGNGKLTSTTYFVYFAGFITHVDTHRKYEIFPEGLVNIVFAFKP